MQMFSQQVVFLMSNLTLDSFQLSFDVHIVHVGSTLTAGIFGGTGS